MLVGINMIFILDHQSKCHIYSFLLSALVYIFVPAMFLVIMFLFFLI